MTVKKRHNVEGKNGALNDFFDLNELLEKTDRTLKSNSEFTRGLLLGDLRTTILKLQVRKWRQLTEDEKSKLRLE